MPPRLRQSPLEAPQIFTGGHWPDYTTVKCRELMQNCEDRRGGGRTHTPDTGQRMQQAVPRPWRVF